MKFEKRMMKSSVSESEFSEKRVNTLCGRLSKVKTESAKLRSDIEKVSRLQISKLASQMESMQRSIEVGL
jgi:hypothetical protein